MARQIRLDIEATPVGDDAEIDQPVLLAALLQGSARRRPLPPKVVDELRERLLSALVRPSYHRAFRELRKGAGEYIEQSEDESAHDPAKQRYIAMRPALDELDERQEEALADVVDGLEDSAAILEWGETVELATHGEVNEVDKPEWVTSTAGSRDLITRCHTEPQTRRLLTSTTAELRPARELFAAVHLVPAYNRGVRDMAGRAGELPDADHTPNSPTQL
ncbi:hypothetical protein VB779_09335 [Haloarculaceae archaeon H-GB11]|nr:hypothetical protein [Haloarculaceae archaeon H-GB11]